MSLTNELRASGFVIYRLSAQQIEYLFLQTSYGQNHWTPPKGHVDPGESDFDTAIRETQEESGLKVQDLEVKKDFKKELHYIVKGKPKIVVYWLAMLKNPTATVQLSEEHQDFKWLTLEPAKKLGRFEEMKSLLDECQSFIAKDN